MELKDKLTKEEIQNTINENRLVLEKVEKSTDREKIAKQITDYDKQIIELMRLPESIENNRKFAELTDKRREVEQAYNKNINIVQYDTHKLDGGENYRELLFRMPNSKNKGYESDHWDESNIIVFTRVDDRTIDNKKTLFIEELQSDWHQDGRKQG